MTTNLPEDVLSELFSINTKVATMIKDGAKINSADFVFSETIPNETAYLNLYDHLDKNLPVDWYCEDDGNKLIVTMSHCKVEIFAK